MAISVFVVFLVALGNSDSFPENQEAVLSEPVVSESPTTTPLATPPILRTNTSVPTPTKQSKTPTLIPSPSLLDDKEMAEFYNGQFQAIDLDNTIIQRHETQIYQSQSWITNINAVLPYQYDYIVKITIPIIQDRQNLIVLLRSSINNHGELIRIRKTIITALKNDDSEAILNISSKLSEQTEITIKADKEINQLNNKLNIELQNLAKITAGQNNSSVPVYTPIPTPFQFITPEPTPTPSPTYNYNPPTEPAICQQIRDDPDYSKSLKQTKLAYYGCY